MHEQPTERTVDTRGRCPTATPREIYSAAMNEWLANNGGAPTLGDPGWLAHEVGLAAVAAAAKAEVLDALKAQLPKPIV